MESEDEDNGRVDGHGYSQYLTRLDEGTIKPGYRLTTRNLREFEKFKVMPDGELEPLDKQEKKRKRSVESVLPIDEKEKARKRFTYGALSEQYWYAKKVSR